MRLDKLLVLLRGQIMACVIKLKTMKKFIFISIIIIIIGILILNYQSDKKLLNSFGQDINNNNIEIKQIIENYMICDEKAKEMTTLQLEYIRMEFNKNPSKILIYTFKEGIDKGEKINGIAHNNYDRVYFICFNDKLEMPILLNENSKIIAISTLNKGGERFFMRTDGGK